MMKPYMFAARLRFERIALVFTLQMAGLALAALLPHVQRHRGMRLLDTEKARQYLSLIRGGRAFVRMWRARVLKGLAGRFPWDVQEMVNNEVEAEERRRKARPIADIDSERPVFYDSRKERKPTELQRLRRRVRQLVHLEMEHHHRRLNAGEIFGV